MVSAAWAGEGGLGFVYSYFINVGRLLAPNIDRHGWWFARTWFLRWAGYRLALTGWSCVERELADAGGASAAEGVNYLQGYGWYSYQLYTLSASWHVFRRLFQEGNAVGEIGQDGG